MNRTKNQVGEKGVNHLFWGLLHTATYRCIIPSMFKKPGLCRPTTPLASVSKTPLYSNYDKLLVKALRALETIGMYLLHRHSAMQVFNPLIAYYKLNQQFPQNTSQTKNPKAHFDDLTPFPCFLRTVRKGNNSNTAKHRIPSYAGTPVFKPAG